MRRLSARFSSPLRCTRLLLTLLLLAWAGTVEAGNIPTTFYVDTAGSDSNTGLATDNAWKTVAKVNAFSRTNQLTYSSQFNNAAWTKSGGVTVSGDNIVAPDGTITADNIIKLAGADGNLTHPIPAGLFTDGDKITYTFYAKTDSGTYVIHIVLIDTPGGTFKVLDPASTTATLTTSWVRYSFTATIPAGWGSKTSKVGFGSYNTWNDTGSFYVWGAQFEVGSFPTPYVMTTSTASAATSFQPGDSILFKRGETWVAEQIVVPSSGTAGHVITFGRYGSGANPIFSAAPDLNGKEYIVLNLTSTGRPTFPLPLFPTWR